MSGSNGMPISPHSSLSMREDRVVALEHRVQPEDDFARAAQDVFALLRTAQRLYPGGLRSLRLEIEGHAGERAGFDADFFEFQQEFLLGTLGQYFSWIELPLTGPLGNPNAQRNDLPDRLAISDGDEDGSPHVPAAN